jgi:quercetin dioxygenase-like cupin family protein
MREKEVMWQAAGIMRTDLQRQDLSIDGYEVVQAHVDLTPEAPPIKHTHPGEETIYVLEGRWSMRSRAGPRRRSKRATR